MATNMDPGRARRLQRRRAIRRDQTRAGEFRVKSMAVSGLWGRRDVDLAFDRSVNVIIGPNASGKTTLLNLLRHILTADLPALASIDFESVVVMLSAFEGKRTRRIEVARADDALVIRVSKRKFEFPLIALEQLSRPRQRHLFHPDVDELAGRLNCLVPAVWLPVSRRLPLPSDEEAHGRHGHKAMESVDFRLRELVGQLGRYRLRLDSALSERYKEFERQVLGLILYSRHHDTLGNFLQETPPTQDQKEQLVRAFQSAGLLNQGMENQIEQHFTQAIESIERVERVPEGENIKIDDILVFPLIRRTKEMVQYAAELEQYRDQLFAPLRLYERIANSFLGSKEVRVLQDGQPVINFQEEEEPISVSALSSGEKQILILLTQALLFEGQPVVYVVDEPELSLHVTWQAKLLESLLELGGTIQLIVATHSPDVVGKFADAVIDLEDVR